MIAKDQERLFAKLRKTHPERSMQFHSGQVHGIVDAETQEEPRPVYAVEATEYARGYRLGFKEAKA